MLNPPSCKDICKNKSTWNNLLAMSGMTLALFVSLINLFVVSSKLPEIGMKKWTTFLLPLDSLDVILILMSIPVGIYLIILVLYVDDLILTGTDSKLLNHVKNNLKKKFEMTNLGFLHYFLSLQVLQTNEGIFLSQTKYDCDLLCRFHMDDCKPTASPFQSRVKLTTTFSSLEVDATMCRQLVGSLLYLAHTHPDLSFVVGLIARYMKTPHESHWIEDKRILRYVCGTIHFGIQNSLEGTPLLVGFTDSDWVSDPDDRKSTAGYVFSLGS
jgi:hypothetical protein